ncbi:cation-translocating P-type ATPase [Frankia sp. AgB1.9]|uniref:cation-translocating P-type ATPase n=1 Tax=unclassified Frankia TaxID=2632575 RepID=UPI001933D880|nr:MULTISPECIES: cation-translocating P-type ATPase [unclassified Frankia]MBL7488064.1 cation-translocating P-type ATPase [Frankia sp. AgW1.1]MBL7548291.1 cation-translocating P-type ATPase [Frankia sp. AgB1.9]MBL7618862.1 cation-translocating P-type ATPase [Frankia sp. AgB1.8]
MEQRVDPDPSTGPTEPDGPERSSVQPGDGVSLTIVGATGWPADPARGLTAAEVASRVAAGQVNDVPARTSRTVREILAANVFTRINLIIGVLFALICVVGPIQDGLFGAVIVANSVIGIIQELRAKQTLDRLAVIGEAEPTVRRDGVAVAVRPGEIVLHDVIETGPGEKIVVDGTVTEADGLEVDESLLTGEADPVLKQPGEEVMSGSFVVAGSGAFVATKVGADAYAARLAAEATRFTLVNSELRNGVNRILRIVTYLIIPAGIALVISQLVVDQNDLPEAIRRMVAGLVSMVPEGLVLLTSLAFAAGVVRLGARNCLVQELPAIEGLARVSVVCLDKTGTLTEPAMDVLEVRALDQAADHDAAAGTSPATGDEPTAPDGRVAAVLGALGAADRRPNASLQAIIDAYPAPDGWRPVDAAPFSSARKWSGAAFIEPDGTESTWLLGAPDVLLATGHPALATVDGYGERGLRVLLLARSDRPLAEALTANGGGTGSAAGGLAGAVEPVALVVIAQRLRADASDTLRYFADQRIATKVISGDNALSVGAVARELGLSGADDPVDARSLPADRAELGEQLETHTIFGRVTPHQKREIVGALQARGETVAMTGDGVNDVLALKDADIGVAMGSGSPATRAVAQIVLLDNSFAALPSVVAEGRRVIGNIERVANIFLTKTVYSVLLAIVVVAAQVPYPFLPRHLTLISSLTIGIPSFFLALAPSHDRARPGFVGRVLRFAVPAGALAGIATVLVYFLARNVFYDNDLRAETSLATLTLFCVSLWALAMIARPYTWWRVLLVAAMAGLFALVLVVPFLQTFFELSLVGTSGPLTALAISAVAAILMEIIWRLVRPPNGTPHPVELGAAHAGDGERAGA